MLLSEFKAAIELTANLLFYVPPHDRKTAIRAAKDGTIKRLISKNIESYPFARQAILDVISAASKTVSKPKIEKNGNQKS
jgi:hypothetical protein